MKQKIKEWFNWTTPSKRFAVAFWIGWFGHSLVMALYQDFIGKEAFIAMTQERWIDMPWLLWVPLVFLALFLYARNRMNFEKEMAWMLIKNPNKVTQEEADAIKVLKQSLSSKPGKTGGFRPFSKPPPPPPGRNIKQGTQPPKPQHCGHSTDTPWNQPKGKLKG